MAQEFHGHDRRRAPRWHLQFPVTYSDTLHGEQVGEAVDVSGEGLGIVLDGDHGVGEASRVRFRLPKTAIAFELAGTVRSVSGNRVSVQFTGVDAPTSVQLFQAIFQEMVRTYRPDVTTMPNASDIPALQQRLSRIENAMSVVSSEIKREALADEADAIRALLAAGQRAFAAAS
jgi:hypothetical protein